MSFPRYPKYKPSDVEWLGELPEHWDVWKLAHAFETIGSGTTPKSDNRDYYEGGDIPWINTGDLNDAGLDECTKRITPLAMTEHTSLKLFPAGSLLIAMYGATIGKLAMLSFPATVNQACCVFSGASPIVSKFMFYWFLGLRQQILSLATGGGQPNVSQDILRTLRVGCPNEDEQNQIAKFLDSETSKIDGLVGEQRRLIELLKEKRQAVISHAVTKGLNPDAPLKPSGIEWLGDVPEHWKVGKCGFYLTILSGFAFPSAGFSEDVTSTKLLRGINVGVSRLKWDETVFWQRKQDDGLDIYEMKAGDLVIGMDRPLIGDGMRVAKVKESDLPCLLLQRVASLKTGERLNGDYLLGLLSSEMFVAHFSPDTTGVSVPHISPEQIGNFIIPVPPITEQEAIVAFVGTETAKFDALTAEAERGIELLQERRTALISAAVTGKIDVRGLVEPELS
jgi:type I restriction enzyme S subunit